MVESGKTYIGFVEENQDPLKKGRCRVRVINVFDDIPKEDIPWATPWKDLNGNSFNVPEIGKILTVIFDNGNIYKPEYIYSEHYNINLENKLSKLEGDNYKSMKTVLFDNKTQIYVNDEEGLKIDYKFNNINFKEKTLNLNLKDNKSTLNLGDETAEQQSILGNNFFDWFDELVDNLLGSFGGPYIGNKSLPVTSHPKMVQVLQKYKALRNSDFLSHHVNIVDNNQITTVKLEDRENENVKGDNWGSQTYRNESEIGLGGENFEPEDGIIQEDRPDDPTYAPPKTDGTPDDELTEELEDDNIPLSDPKSNKELDKLIRFLENKNYVVYNENYKINIVGFRNPVKDDGTSTNKFDDFIWVFYKNGKGNWVLNKYKATTVPGYKKKTTLVEENRAILKLGQYVDQYRLGYHKGRKDHLCLKYAKTVVKRQSKSQQKYDLNSPEDPPAYIGINIHRSGDVQGYNVFNWSHGCQVFKVRSAFEQFMKICKLQVQKTGKERFSYALCKKSEFDKFE